LQIGQIICVPSF